jgi:hypothetical protein
MKHLKQFEKFKDNLVGFRIPNYSLSYLINNDPSSLSDEEKEEIDVFCQNVIDEYGNAYFLLGDEVEDDLGFCQTNDINILGDNCVRLYIKPNTPEEIKKMKLNKKAKKYNVI